jgi:hypothetical protein
MWALVAIIIWGSGMNATMNIRGVAQFDSKELCEGAKSQIITEAHQYSTMAPRLLCVQLGRPREGQGG